MTLARPGELAEEEAQRTRERVGLPLSRGGLGLKPLAPVRHAAHVGSWLQVAHSVAEALGEAVPAALDWTTAPLPCQQHVHAAVSALQTDYGVDALDLCSVTWSSFADREKAKQQRTLATAVWQVRLTRWEATATPRDKQTLLSASKFLEIHGNHSF